MSDPLDRWLDPDEEEADEHELDEGEAFFIGLDALHDERAERGDARWQPSGGDLERLVEDRRARGVLRLPPTRPLR